MEPQISAVWMGEVENSLSLSIEKNTGKDLCRKSCPSSDFFLRFISKRCVSVHLSVSQSFTIFDATQLWLTEDWRIKTQYFTLHQSQSRKLRGHGDVPPPIILLGATSSIISPLLIVLTLALTSMHNFSWKISSFPAAKTQPPWPGTPSVPTPLLWHSAPQHFPQAYANEHVKLQIGESHLTPIS